MAIKKLSKEDAKALAKKMGINFSKDFFELSMSDKETLVSIAKLKGYRKPSTASGSTARYFFEYLTK